MEERRAREAIRASLSEKISDRVTRFAGSMTFVGVHAVAYGLWVAVNLGAIPGVRPFDPSFVVLAMEASVEADLLSTFVLISQNRMMGAAARQSDLDLQINLLAEHELTRLVKLVDAMATKMGVDVVDREELSEIVEMSHQRQCSIAWKAGSTREQLDPLAHTNASLVSLESGRPFRG